MNVTLIGMAGSGKSYIGKRLAEYVGVAFLDNDEELEKAHGKPIQSILDALGERAYLDEEMNVLMRNTRGKNNIVISPGGSIIYRVQAMDYLKDISVVVYLKVPQETVESRLSGLPPRAIIGLGRKSVRELYDERHPLYEAYADFVIEPTGRSEEEVLRAIAEYVAER